MKTKYLLFFLAFLASLDPMSAQDWNVVEVGPCPTQHSFDVAVADGRNDGVKRLYVTTAQGGLYEWTFQDDQWTLTSTIVSDLIALTPIAIGEGRNDGITRIYITEFKNANARVREFTWNGQDWDQQVLMDQLQSLGIALGDGRNDGKNRLYVTSIRNGLLEFSYENNTWSHTSLESSGGEGTPDIGDGRNNGENAVYSPSTYARESRYVNGQFVTEALDVPMTAVDALQVAPGRNDGVNRVYANLTGNAGSGRKEYTWNGSSWDIEVIESAGQRGDIHVTRLQADGKYRVYINTSEYFRGSTGPLDEYEWDGAQWVKTENVMATGTHATAMMTSGEGRNDGIVRLYAPHWTNGGIYEITYKEPFVPGSVANKDVVKNDVQWSILPNPVAGNEPLRIELSGVENGSILEVLDLQGNRVFSENINRGTQYIDMDQVPETGYYLVRIVDTKGMVFSKKIIRL